MKIFLYILSLFAGKPEAGTFYSDIALLSQKWNTIQEIDADFDDILMKHGIPGKFDPGSIHISTIDKTGKPGPLNNKYTYVPERKKLFLEVHSETNDDISFKKYRIYFKTGTAETVKSNEKNYSGQKLLPDDENYLFYINKISHPDKEKHFFPFEINQDYKNEYILLTTLPSQNSNCSFRALPSTYEISIRLAAKNISLKSWKLRAIIGFWSESENKFLVPFCETTFAEVNGIKDLTWTTFKKAFTPPPDTDYLYMIVYINKANPGGTIWIDRPQIKIVDVTSLNKLFKENNNDSQ